jgi:hypothetical protein
MLARTQRAPAEVVNIAGAALDGKRWCAEDTSEASSREKAPRCEYQEVTMET